MKILSPSAVSFCFKIACVIGLTTQVVNIFAAYFKYKTITRTSMGVENILPIPTISVCSFYTDILDRSKSANYSINSRIPIGLQEINSDQNKLTVGGIFFLTPKYNETLGHCKIRVNDSYSIATLSSSSCYDVFHVNRYYMQELMCYGFRPKHIHNYRLTRASHSLNYNQLLWEIFLDKKFHPANELTFITQITAKIRPPHLVGESLPLYSRNFAQSMFRIRDPKKAILASNVFYVTHEWNRIFLKPPPYDTDCNPYLGKYDCIRQCMQEKLLRINRVPFTEITTEDALPSVGHLFPVRPIDLEDSKMEQYVYDSESYCEKKCQRLPCRLFFSKTSVNAFLDERFNYSSRIRATSPASPTVDVTSVANFDLYQLVIYICSCFGVWLGVSVMSLDPSKSRFIVQTIYCCCRKQVRPKEVRDAETTNASEK